MHRTLTLCLRRQALSLAFMLAHSLDGGRLGLNFGLLAGARRRLGLRLRVRLRTGARACCGLGVGLRPLLLPLLRVRRFDRPPARQRSGPLGVCLVVAGHAQCGHRACFGVRVPPRDAQPVLLRGASQPRLLIRPCPWWPPAAGGPPSQCRQCHYHLRRERARDECDPGAGDELAPHAIVLEVPMEQRQVGIQQQQRHEPDEARGAPWRHHCLSGPRNVTTDDFVALTVD